MKYHHAKADTQAQNKIQNTLSYLYTGGLLTLFLVEEEKWSQVTSRGEQPPPRHAHSAVMHDNHMWVYGGMTDLQERNDFWRYDTGKY
ncbi:hypothetical protein Pcinc_027666 [Petrolisthes cinctipes]|uniref:Uncharacterized protein n=1 Tax=Petrolisthes cinctipes TaxID=88211 RepID=A0AAE1F453_PETCI|nr:hypothetical protein Pcinc_031356 [Petrolisthes cinctipes]KAK3866833.1 hypothetical protein Pcinc_027666 [Petrolisthes cinctipes]